MDETPDLHPLLTDLSTEIDALTTTLTPLISHPLSQQTATLPLLDQAKLYALATYAIESLLFSSLRLSGVDAKAHPVFQELGRVKEYFGKIRVAESGGAGGSAKKGGGVRVDREAVGRFIRAGLAGNERLDRERAAAGAKRKLEGVHTRFDGVVEDEGGSAQDAGTKSSEGDGPKRKKHKGRKAPKAANRFGAEYADLATRDAAEEAAEEDGEVSGHAESDDEAVNSTTGQTPQKARSKSSTKPKTSKEALETLLDDAAEGKSGKKKRNRKKSVKKVEDAQAEEMQ